MFFIEPSHFNFTNTPDSMHILYSLGLTFFAFQGFSVITNSVEDMENPSKIMLKAMTIAIILVGILYIAVSIAVFGNLSLDEIIKSEDFLDIDFIAWTGHKGLLGPTGTGGLIIKNENFRA